MQLCRGPRVSAGHGLACATSQALIIKELLVWMRETILTERPELFLKDDSVRPGILVLINDTDWEITGHLDTELADGDTLAFISTLHGG
mmetsp:Transcript_26981/g.69289  ORF Transcript_26981/g.69289 Transcript_26981/m.69289 type:complete len:89 (-) Transcript_26981:1644-1910(-)